MKMFFIGGDSPKDKEGVNDIFTVGKVYDVEEGYPIPGLYNEPYYVTIDDTDTKIAIPHKYFTTIEDYRNKQLKNINI